MRSMFVILVFALVGLLAVDLEPGAAPHAAAVVAAKKKEIQTVEVAFVRNGRLVRVERVVPHGVSPEVLALRELVQGPTKAEHTRGYRTALRPGVRLRSLRAEGGVWFASFSRSLLASGTDETVRMRLAQLEATLARLGPERYVALATEGRFVTTLPLGTRPGAWQPERGEQDYLYSTRGIQLRLWTLGYLDRKSVTGELDDETSQALLAFQGWEDLARTGTVTGETQLALERAEPPTPTAHRAGRRIEIYRDRGVVLMLDGNEVVRAVHTSTGSFGRTPMGAFHVYRKELLSWSEPFHVWMPYASYFIGGIAMHEYSYVPGYPASHGCVRLPAGDAPRVYEFVQVGTPVHVY
jgi:hypothetical protein